MSSTRSPQGAKTLRYKRADERWASLAAKIAAHAPLLFGQGDLVLKRIGANRYWYLRFLLPPDEMGHRRHRSVYVGRASDEDLVARVRALLDDCRRSRQWIKELDACVRLAAILKRVVQCSSRRIRAGDNS
jgi:hypothetical protein